MFNDVLLHLATLLQKIASMNSKELLLFILTILQMFLFVLTSIICFIQVVFVPFISTASLIAYSLSKKTNYIVMSVGALLGTIGSFVCFYVMRSINELVPVKSDFNFSLIGYKETVLAMGVIGIFLFLFGLIIVEKKLYSKELGLEIANKALRQSSSLFALPVMFAFVSLVIYQLNQTPF